MALNEIFLPYLSFFDFQGLDTKINVSTSYEKSFCLRALSQIRNPLRGGNKFRIW